MYLVKVSFGITGSEQIGSEEEKYLNKKAKNGWKLSQDVILIHKFLLD